MIPRSSTVWALLCLYLLFDLAAAGLLPRDDPVPTVTGVTTTSEEDGTRSTTPTTSVLIQTSSANPTDSSSSVTSTASISTTLAATASTTVSSASSLSTGIDGTGSLNETLFNTTIPAGQLPIQPRVTPGWGVAGVILLGCGAVYALIGMKKQWLHTFFSTAFLASLSTAVLIVYVMPVPVSNGVQGAYVVAVVCTGVVLGGAAIIFKEITECMGCVLGGFCLSMWLLTLREGGLIQNTSGKIVLIACFSAGTPILYFSHYTRQYALIGCIAFGGATATVLGIDCLSRAGLKEFWAYIWDLNDNIFPLGTVTYPLTKGIRVELAATIIICLAGIISQLKLWRVIQERRAKRDAKRAEDRRQLDEEEEQVGRQIEEANAQDRGQWEAVYGERNRDARDLESSADSGVGDMSSEKRLRHNSHGTATTGTRRTSDIAEPIEMADFPTSEQVPAVPPKPKAAAQMVMGKSEKDGAVTVRVAVDEVPNGEKSPSLEEQRKTWVIGGDGEARQVVTSVRNSLKSVPTSPIPSIVPLPFRIPEGQPEDDDGERSSVATFADEDGEVLAGAQSKRSSFAKRLSVGSTELLRRLSKKSSDMLDGSELRQRESEEDLVVPKVTNDDNESLAATIDGMSSIGDDLASIHGTARPESIEIKATLGGQEQPDSSSLEPPHDAEVTGDRPVSMSGTMSADVVRPRRSEEPKDAQSLAQEPRLSVEVTQKVADGSRDLADELKAKSVASVGSSRASLTKERLPQSLSRVAMSYRTNEWAKHLSTADAPAMEDLDVHEDQGQAPAAEKVAEAPAPVKIEELQQTAENGAPPPALPRSAASASAYPTSPTILTRANSQSSAVESVHAGVLPSQSQGRNGLNPPSPTSGLPGPHPRPGRRTSNIIAEPIAEEGDYEPTTSSSAPSISSGRNSMSAPSNSFEPGVLNRPPVPGVVSYSSPQTLLGKREMLLRRVSGNSPPGSIQGMVVPPSSSHNSFSPVYARAPGASSASPGGIDADDLPLSQRRELIRQSSLLSSRPSSASMNQMGISGAPYSTVNATAVPFDSHQPQRSSTLPSAAVRDARLASFRQSVSADLRAGTPIIQSGTNGRETLLAGGGAFGFSSPTPLAATNRDAEVRQNIDMQRNILLSQREAEAQRREMERLQKEAGDRAFEERMRRGELLDVHREAMRRMQRGAR
ncbi:Sulfite exporter family protein [Pleurostoma richardsiae]|uniref:Sulfite exporter family protein n=1 Tax=Pleurostoma richardsiae TaxID=41990 RepID=A0AA38RL29_9PEZI|nr:Sulfite exporter family protein [Pleurostoma richardsiae]